jgi:hypothetical protein
VADMNKQQLLQKEIKMSENLSLNKDNKRKKVLTTFFGAVGLIGAGFTAYYILYSSNYRTGNIKTERKQIFRRPKIRRSLFG